MQQSNRREKESKNQPNARDMKRELKQTYHYTSKNTGKRETVCCTRNEYLYMKLCYDVNGLSLDEFKEYKAAIR